MISQKVRRAYIICVVLCGVSINTAYGVELLKEFFDPQFKNTVREILISAIALEFGWAALLLSVVGQPCERRHIVLFTAIPIIIGNLLHGINQYVFSDGRTDEISVNLVIGAIVAGFFVLAFLLGNPKEYSFSSKRK